MLEDSNITHPINSTLAPTINTQTLRDSFGISRILTADTNQRRVQKYTQVYKSNRPKSSKSYGKSTTRDLNHESELENTPSVPLNKPRPITRSISRYSSRLDSYKKVDKLQNNLKSLLYDLQKTLSDKSELIRDLSTYEHNFAESNELFVRLGRLRADAISLPEDFSLVREKIVDKEILDRLKSGLSDMIKLDTQTQITTHQEAIETESFEIRKSLQLQKLDTVFQGISIISSIPCIINVRSDKWLEHLEISVQTIQGLSFQLNLRLTISNSYQNSKQILKTIKHKILPHLYFKYFNDVLSLFFDTKHAVYFYSLICEIKGLGLCSIEITENEEDVHIKPSLTDHALEIPRYIVTSETSIFKVKIAHIRYMMTKYLCFTYLNKMLF